MFVRNSSCGGVTAQGYLLQYYIHIKIHNIYMNDTVALNITAKVTIAQISIDITGTTFLFVDFFLLVCFFVFLHIFPK